MLRGARHLFFLVISVHALQTTWLRRALGSRTSPQERQQAIDSLFQLRSEKPEAFTLELDCVRAALAKAPLGKRGLVARVPVALPFSWHRRDLVCLSALIVENEEGSSDDVSMGDSEERRKLASTLRQLPDSGGVWRLRREARVRRGATTFEEMLRRTPEIETPAFEIVEDVAAQRFHVRSYSAFSVARTSRSAAVMADGEPISEPKMSGAGGFQALAGYIFGRNDRSEAMAMTTPVFSRGDSMEFVMPSAYWGPSIASAPAPVSAGVTVAPFKAELWAAVYFGGYASQTEIARRKTELEAIVAASPKFERIDQADDIVFAAYNDPFQPPWKRRNEVLLRVQPV